MPDRQPTHVLPNPYIYELRIKGDFEHISGSKLFSLLHRCTKVLIMKIRMGQVIFGVGVFLITIWALLQIKKSNENNSERFSKFESDRKKPSHESVQESEEIHEQRTTTLG